jgi:hypothetical protein
MSTPVLFNGVTYNVPSFNDVGYAQGPGNMSLYWIALAGGTLQQSGGTFSLTSDANFGTNFGLISKYFTSVSANPATAGAIRLANLDTIDWRNFANTGNIALGVNSSDQLTFQGTPITPIPTLGLLRNRVRNGAMIFDQMREGLTSYPATNPETYTLDQMRVGGQTSATFATLQDTAVLPPNSGFYQTIRFNVSAPAAVVAGDFPHLEVPIEGQDIRDFLWGTAAAKTITLSFWALCSKAGTYSVAIINGVDSIYYITTYVLAVANTWQFFTITIPGPTTGAWQITPSTFGIKIIYDLGSGATFTGAGVNAWTAGTAWKAPGSASLTTGADSLYLTGIQLELGATVTPFEVMTYQMELELLQRYYWKSMPPGLPVLAGQGSIGALTYVSQLAGIHSNGVHVRLPIPQMSNSASYLTFSTQIGGTNPNWYNNTQALGSGAASVVNSGASGFFVINPQLAGDNAGSTISIHVSASCRLGGI